MPRDPRRGHFAAAFFSPVFFLPLLFFSPPAPYRNPGRAPARRRRKKRGRDVPDWELPKLVVTPGMPNCEYWPARSWYSRYNTNVVNGLMSRLTIAMLRAPSRIIIVINTVFDLISEYTLISEHPPPHFVLVKTIARAHRDLCVLAVLLCCIMLLCCASCNRYLMLINHPTDDVEGLLIR